jgi:hypothetical protein
MSSRKREGEKGGIRRKNEGTYRLASYNTARPDSRSYRFERPAHSLHSPRLQRSREVKKRRNEPLAREELCTELC